MKGKGPKQSRLTAIWITISGKRHRICNGCYGSIVGVSNGSKIAGGFLETINTLL